MTRDWTRTLDWDKSDGLLPAIVQDAGTGAVLMLGYMNREALAATQATGRVTFWSRSKGRLWTKGETSGHFLEVCSDRRRLRRRHPADPGASPRVRSVIWARATCWGESAPRSRAQPLGVPGQARTDHRAAHRRRARRAATPRNCSSEGMRRIAQKVGEEGLELALAGVAQSDEEVIGEAADLLYHTLLLLKAKGLSLSQVVAELESAACRSCRADRVTPPS